mgnify:CR=1 FL=1
MNIIVGGTHGLGREIADILQRNGQTMCVIGRSYKQQQHGNGLKIDLASADDALKLAQYIRDLVAQELNFYWISGYGYTGDFSAQESPDTMAAVNFGHMLPAAQAVWQRLLTAAQVGRFVVVSSTTGIKPRTHEAVYAGTKHAQVGFTRSLGLESERLGAKVKVSLFMPGGMQTPFWEGKRPADFDTFLDPAKVAQRIVERVEGQTGAYYEEVIERGSL